MIKKNIFKLQEKIKFSFSLIRSFYTANYMLGSMQFDKLINLHYISKYIRPVWSNKIIEK